MRPSLPSLVSPGIMSGTCRKKPKELDSSVTHNTGGTTNGRGERMKHLDNPKSLLYFMMLIRAFDSVFQRHLPMGSLPERCFISRWARGNIRRDDCCFARRRFHSKPSPGAWSHDCPECGHQKNDGRNVRPGGWVLQRERRVHAYRRYPVRNLGANGIVEGQHPDRDWSCVGCEVYGQGSGCYVFLWRGRGIRGRVS